MTVQPVLDCEDLGVEDLDFLLGVLREGRTLLVLVGVVSELLQAVSGVSDFTEDKMLAFLGRGDTLATVGWAGAISTPKLGLLTRNLSINYCII